MDKVEKKLWASAKGNGDFIFIQTDSGYRGGMNVDYKGAKYFLSPEVSDAALGEALLDALSRSRFVLPTPQPGSVYPPEVEFDKELYSNEKSNERYQQWIEDVMKRYGYKTKRALFKNMKNCSVEVADSIVTIRPWHHEKLEGWNGDGIRREDYVVLSVNGTPTEIGAALRLAFSRCT